jgi:transketolase
VGSAAGLALRGRIPVVHGLASFLTMRAFEFIRTDVGIGQLPVKLVGGVPGILSDGNGPTHQAIEDVALMRSVPGMEIFCPADEQDMILGLKHVLASPNPCYIRHNPQPPVIDHGDFFLGRAELVMDGSDVTVIAYGTLFLQAYQAARLLEEKGLSVKLLNLRMLRPVDEEALLEVARRTRLVVTVEDHLVQGGLFSIVAELLVRRHVTAHVLPVAFEDRWFKPATLLEAMAYEGFTGPQIAERIWKEFEQAVIRKWRPLSPDGYKMLGEC